MINASICDLCRETAPANFKRNDDGGHSFVYKQAEVARRRRLCKEAMEGCPVEAIGNDGVNEVVASGGSVAAKVSRQLKRSASSPGRPNDRRFRLQRRRRYSGRPEDFRRARRLRTDRCDVRRRRNSRESFAGRGGSPENGSRCKSRSCSKISRSARSKPACFARPRSSPLWQGSVEARRRRIPLVSIR